LVARRQFFPVRREETIEQRYSRTLTLKTLTKVQTWLAQMSLLGPRLVNRTAVTSPPHCQRTIWLLFRCPYLGKCGNSTPRGQAFLAWTPDSRFTSYFRHRFYHPTAIRIRRSRPKKVQRLLELKDFLERPGNLSVFLVRIIARRLRSLLSVDTSTRRSTPSICSSGKFV